MFPNARFYGGQINKGINESDAPPARGFDWPHKSIPFAFIHVPNKEDVSMPPNASNQAGLTPGAAVVASNSALQNGFVVNHREAELVGKVLLKFLQAKEVYPEHICILTPYGPQKMRLKQEISTLKAVEMTLTSEVRKPGKLAVLASRCHGR